MPAHTPTLNGHNGHPFKLEYLFPAQSPPADPLTGLCTLPALKQALQRLLAQSRRQPVTASLALLQLANFYEIRTWVGRPEADLLLGRVAATLRAAVPDGAELYRCEHYEFALLLGNEQSHNANSVVEQLRLALLGTQFDGLPAQLEMECAAGVVPVHSSLPNVDVLFARARHDLRQNREQPAAELQAFAYLHQSPGAVVALVRSILRSQSLHLNFQPTVAFLASKIEGYEVRAAMTPDHDAVPATVLFMQASLNALGEALDRYVIVKSLAALAQDAAATWRLTVNLGLNSLVSDDFLRWLDQRLQRYPSCRSRLSVQISEADALIAQHYLGDFSEALRQLGIALGITHFGCMNEPLCYLPRVKVDFVKLDTSLTDNVHSDALRHAQLLKLVQRLHKHRLQVCAGKVESQHRLLTLFAAGIDAVQGYALAKPQQAPGYHFASTQRFD